MILFLIPFVLVGLVLVGGVVYQLLALFNPKCSLTLSKGSPCLGDTLSLDWRFDGKYRRVRKLTVSLEGRESATYQVGTNTRTDHSVFHREVLAEQSGTSVLVSDGAQFEIPAHLMHSVDYNNNKIEWSILVHGDIPRWPDIKDRYPITVHPLSSER